jgi:membrane protein
MASTPLAQEEVGGVPASGVFIALDRALAHPRQNRLPGRSIEPFPRSYRSNAWNLHDLTLRGLVVRTWRSLIADRVFGHAAELGFYFLFALFPTLFCAGSALGLAARSAEGFYDRLLGYLSLVIPTSALGAILSTFNETAAAATSGKVTFGSVAAIWSASVGISALQDVLNAVHKIEDSRSYLVARIYAIGLTILLTLICSLALAAMFGGDFLAAMAHHTLANRLLATFISVSSHVAGWAVATALLALAFAVIYQWAPDWKHRRWQWLTPGGIFGILGWLIASLGFRAYLHFFNSYTVTYGSLGAVIILLMWFYITGLMLLVGAEINSEIEALVPAFPAANSAEGDLEASRDQIKSSSGADPPDHSLRSDTRA